MLVAGNKVPGLLRALVLELKSEYPRQNIFCLSHHPRTCDIPADILLPHPYISSWIIRRLYARSKAQILILTPGSQINPYFVDLAQQEGINVVMLGSPGANQTHSHGIDLFLSRNQFDVEQLRSMEEQQGKIYALQHSEDEAAAKEIVRILGPKIVSKKNPVTKKWSVKRRLMNTVTRGPLRSVCRYKYDRIPTLEALRSALGDPECILCLGNGPSSEDPRLQQLNSNAVFRVNHKWLQRGYFTQADMIFTGSKSTVKAYRGESIFGFQTLASEEKMLAKCLWIPRKIRYACAESLGTVDFASFGVFRPTNGVIMLATAVALAPQKLVIAGIDLFQHPTGSYPGDASTPNAYTLGHDRDTEQRVILEILAQYRGELVIMSEVLDTKWREFRDRRDNEHQTASESTHA